MKINSTFAPIVFLAADKGATGAETESESEVNIVEAANEVADILGPVLAAEGKKSQAVFAAVDKIRSMQEELGFSQATSKTIVRNAVAKMYGIKENKVAPAAKGGNGSAYQLTSEMNRLINPVDEVAKKKLASALAKEKKPSLADAVVIARGGTPGKTKGDGEKKGPKSIEDVEALKATVKKVLSRSTVPTEAAANALRDLIEDFERGVLFEEARDTTNDSENPPVE